MSAGQRRHPGATPRGDLTGAAELAELRAEIFRSLGLERGRGVLYGMGFIDGLRDASRVMRGFEGNGEPAPRFAGPMLPLLFQPEQSDLRARFSGTLPRSLEAELHQAEFPAPTEPVCVVSAGYGAGWYSEILRERILVLETGCRACGALTCRFEARRLEDWQMSRDVRVLELLPYLDFDHLRERALEASHDDGENTEGEMLGQFDPMSPAVYVWGPVMILPYSGAADSEAALETIRQDIGPDQVRVVVVDTTGARIDPLEVAGLARLLHRIHDSGIQAVVAGLDQNAIRPFRAPQETLALPLFARDLSEGIALGFQMCQGPSLES